MNTLIKTLTNFNYSGYNTALLAVNILECKNTGSVSVKFVKTPEQVLENLTIEEIVEYKRALETKHTLAYDATEKTSLDSKIRILKAAEKIAVSSSEK